MIFTLYIYYSTFKRETLARIVYQLFISEVYSHFALCRSYLSYKAWMANIFLVDGWP